MLCNPLQCQISFFLAEFVGAITYFVSTENFNYSKLLKPVLPMTSRLIVANHLRCHAVLELLRVKLISEFALSIAIYLYLNFFQTFLQDRLPNMREILNNI